MTNELTKEYQLSDFVFMNACKEYFGGKKHHAVCDKFIQFLCVQLNNGNQYSEEIKKALAKEPLVIKSFLEREHWGKLFRYMYNSAQYCLTLAEQGDLENAMSLFFIWHDYVCNTK